MDLLKTIDRVAEILNLSEIKEIKVKDGSSSIFMTKNAATTNFVSTPSNNVAIPAPALDVNDNPISANLTATEIKTKEQIAGQEIKSPMVGIFYQAASPEAMPYVKEGQQVKKGDILCIIEAMKIMNKIEAEKSGKITRILVRDGDAVQFDQPLFIIE